MPKEAGVKETLCTCCEHREVCAHKQDYLDILEAVENARVLKEMPDGKISSKKVTNYDFISEISIGCHYYRNWTGVYRDYVNDDQMAT
jgi:hypothetical protein